MFLPWQLDLLNECRVARLGTISASGAPHLAPVCFALFEGSIAIAIDEKPKRTLELARLANIRRDPRVTLLVDWYDDDWARLAWVRIDGTAKVLEHASEWPGALGALRKRYWQYETMELETLPAIRIEAKRVSGWRFSESASSVSPP
jgi:PPOX class probable F420-dependent enzyme